MTVQPSAAAAPSTLERLLPYLVYAVVAVPFLWALIGRRWPEFAADLLPPLYQGRYLALSWGSAVVIFTSGALFGMVARSALLPGLALLIAAIPALWTWVLVNDATDISVIYLMAGLAGLFLIELMFARQGVAPGWWIGHRLAVTLLALATLASFLI